MAESAVIRFNGSMGAGESISTAARRIPWWGSALAGVGAILVLTAPVASRFGTGGGPHYGWYATAEETLHTGLIVDQIQYLNLVDSTAGEAAATEVAPFTARSLGPWLAGLLPLDAHPALTLVLLASLVLGTFALARLAMDLTRRRDAVLLAVTLWAVSFPVLKYTGDAFTDPAAVGLIPVVLLCIWRRWILAALPIFFAAVWMKETALVLAPVGITFAAMQPGRGRLSKWVTAAAWLLVAAAAYLTASTPGGEHLLVFAPWVPDSLETVRASVSFNLLQPPRLIAFGATIAPALFGVVMWWRSRRAGSPVFEDPTAVPLVVGCAAGAAIGLSALPTALMDGRSVWTTLPFGALLVAGWWASREASGAREDLTAAYRALRWPVAALAVLWIVAVALVPLPVGERALENDYQPRFAGVPEDPEATVLSEFSGDGSGSVELPVDGPVLIRFEGEEAVGISYAGTDDSVVQAVGAGGALSGVTMFDPQVDAGRGSPVLRIDSAGPWTIEVRSVSTSLFESISPVSGVGPNVIVYPGGLPRAVRVNWTSDDADDRVMLVGGCRLGTCGDLGEDGIVPAGTEALVIDASGDWSVSPTELSADEEHPVLAGTEATLRTAAG